MKLTDKRFWKFEALMLLCGMISIVINPLLYTFGPDIYWENYMSGLYFCLFIIVYPLAGCCAWFSFRKITAWWKRAVIISFLVILLLSVAVFRWICIFIKDGMTGLVFLSGSFMASVFSILPVAIGSYLFQKYQMKNL